MSLYHITRGEAGRGGRSSLRLGLLVLLLSRSLPAQGIERLSVSSAGGEGNNVSAEARMDRSGRYVVFRSFADNLVAGDANLLADAFLHDRQTGTTHLVSRDSAGALGDGAAGLVALSGDGNLVSFSSEAANMVGGDTNGVSDVFLRNLQTGNTHLVSVGINGGPANAPSELSMVLDSGLVAFTSNATDLVVGMSNSFVDCYVRDMQNGTTECVTVDLLGQPAANGSSFSPVLSDDGRWVVFNSGADNLVANDSNGFYDIFVRDRTTQVTRLISTARSGGASNGNSVSPWIAGDGSCVVFESQADNLVGNDTNGVSDVFVHDLGGSTHLISVSTTGERGNGPSAKPHVDPTGRWVTFISAADNLVPQDTNGQTDIFVRDRQFSVTFRVSLGAGAAESDGYSYAPFLAGDGGVMVFSSYATNLVPGDSNGMRDVFARQLAPAGVSYFGSGHPGTLGLPQLNFEDDPIIGTDPGLTLVSSNPAGALGFLLVGMQRATVPTGWGSDILVRAQLYQALALPPGALTLRTPIKHLEGAEGLTAYLQLLQIDPGASDGVAFSRGASVTVGFWQASAR